MNQIDSSVMFVISFALGCLTTGAGVYWHVKRPQIRLNSPVTSLALAVLMVGVFALAQVAPAAAQTPVPLEIPTDVIFTETNNWLETFAPIAAIGIGITIALAVLGYLGKMIAGAFRG